MFRSYTTITTLWMWWARQSSTGKRKKLSHPSAAQRCTTCCCTSAAAARNIPKRTGKSYMPKAKISSMFPRERSIVCGFLTLKMTKATPSALISFYTTTKTNLPFCQRISGSLTIRTAPTATFFRIFFNTAKAYPVPAA